ncbi:MAG: glycosyltransferase family 1 protein [Crocinitomicaceae bacterium]|nr:MAG: glycosyltransferase family 1 protein [Crocinitomicaceae bacterium]
MENKKLIRISTVPISLEKLLENQLSFMNDYFDVIAVSSEKERLESFGKENKVRIKYIELTRQITPIKDLIALWKMYWFLKREKPFIVHSHTPKAGTIGMLAAKLAGVPHRLHTVAGLPLLEVTGIKRKLLNFVEKITYWAATQVYPNSNGLKEIILAENFCKKEKLKVIGNGSSNGINTSFFDSSLFSSEEKNKLREQLKIQELDFVFIFVGRLVGDKGINELIEAFTQIELTSNNCKLILVGPFETELDPLQPTTLSLIDTNKNIICVGYQKDVRPFFAISNCLVFPSYREGFPNVVMQAGAMGLPSIVSDINGCNELIVENVNGIIIPPKNTKLLTHAMKSIIDNRYKTEQMALNSREMITSKFEQKLIWGSLKAEYDSLSK